MISSFKRNVQYLKLRQRTETCCSQICLNHLKTVSPRWHRATFLVQIQSLHGHGDQGRVIGRNNFLVSSKLAQESTHELSVFCGSEDKSNLITLSKNRPQNMSIRNTFGLGFTFCSHKKHVTQPPRRSCEHDLKLQSIAQLFLDKLFTVIQ